MQDCGQRTSRPKKGAENRRTLRGLSGAGREKAKHFRNKDLAQLAQERGLVHVPIHRHRPQSNGVAERFVRTLKDWLFSQRWRQAAELRELLEQFPSEYNDRPHQGLAIPGLSPNEFANRVWLM